MAFELKDMQWNLHKQDPAKKKKENSPDFFGTIKIHDTEYRLSGWGKMSNDGKPYISGMVSVPDETSRAPQEAVDSFMVTDKMAHAMTPGPLEDESIPAPERPTRSQHETEEQSEDLPF